MATIKDVARLAGVGVGTASRVISGKGSFSPDAAARVEAAAQQLGFRPSAIARALSLRSTGTIGVFVPDFAGPFYGPLLPEDTNGKQDVYVRRGTDFTSTILISRAGAAGAIGDDDSSDPTVSQNGDFVAFTSDASNFARAAL